MRTFIFILTALPLLAKTPEWERAQLLFDASEFKQAAAILEKAPKNDVDNLLLLGQSYMQLKKHSDAVDVLEHASEVAPKRPEVFVWLGRALGRLAESNKLLAFGRARKARAAFEKAVQLDPDNREGLDDLFEFYIQAPAIVGGGLDKAEGVAKKIATLDPPEGERLLARVARERKK